MRNPSPIQVIRNPYPDEIPPTPIPARQPQPTATIVRNPRVPLDKPDPLNEQQREHRRELLSEYIVLVKAVASGSALSSKQLERLATVETVLGIPMAHFKADVEAVKRIAQSEAAIPDAAEWARRSRELADAEVKLAAEIKATEQNLRDLRGRKSQIDAERRNRIGIHSEIVNRRAAAWRLTEAPDDVIDKLESLNRRLTTGAERVNYYGA